ncbi:MAG: hypothetical protein Q9160_006750 [Pyrenula sp. 1 TL-2023]
MPQAPTYPPLSRLQFHDPLLPSSSPSATLSRSRALLRRETLSLGNRFKSILKDVGYVCRLQDALISASAGASGTEVGDEEGREGLGDGGTGCKWLLIANERNGSWYVPPQPERERRGVNGEGGGKAYFKSTDGHFGRWGFSTRRLNLGFLGALGGKGQGGEGGKGGGGAILVDSTRTGKILPDALSKTVPIWTAVINAALFPTMPSSHTLQTPPSFSVSSSPSDHSKTYLPASEISQITSRLPSFISSFHALDLPVDALRVRLRNKPIKLVWAIHGMPGLTTPEIEEEDLEKWNILVLCSASRRVSGDGGQDGYVQGAADDAEGWSRGLTASGFWEVVEKLGGWKKGLGNAELSVDEEGLRDMVEEEVRRWKGEGERGLEVEVAQGLVVGKAGDGLMERVEEDDSLIVICNGRSPSEVADSGKLNEFRGEREEEDYAANEVNEQNDSSRRPSNQLYLDLPTGKLGSRALRKRLSQVELFIRATLEKDMMRPIVVTCETGKNLSVGVALMIVCLFYGDEGGPS